MTHLLHTFEDRPQHAHLEFLASSRAASTQLAENYTGTPHIWRYQNVLCGARGNEEGRIHRARCPIRSTPPHLPFPLRPSSVCAKGGEKSRRGPHSTCSQTTRRPRPSS